MQRLQRGIDGRGVGAMFLFSSLKPNDFVTRLCTNQGPYNEVRRAITVTSTWKSTNTLSRKGTCHQKKELVSRAISARNRTYYINTHAARHAATLSSETKRRAADGATRRGGSAFGGTLKKRMIAGRHAERRQTQGRFRDGVCAVGCSEASAAGIAPHRQPPR